jgi:hypothetical protein
MRLPRPFFQLPLLLDAARLQTEVAALPPEAWLPHPDSLPGNSAAQLISPGGVETLRRFAGKVETGKPGRTDPGIGPMRMTV